MQQRKLRPTYHLDGVQDCIFRHNNVYLHQEDRDVDKVNHKTTTTHTRRIGHLMDHQILMKIRLGTIAEDEHFSQSHHLQNTVGLPFRILCA
jgi:hypothetical protein